MKGVRSAYDMVCFRNNENEKSYLNLEDATAKVVAHYSYENGISKNKLSQIIGKRERFIENENGERISLNKRFMQKTEEYLYQYKEKGLKENKEHFISNIEELFKNNSNDIQEDLTNNKNKDFLEK